MKTKKKPGSLITFVFCLCALLVQGLLLLISVGCLLAEQQGFWTGNGFFT